MAGTVTRTAQEVVKPGCRWNGHPRREVRLRRGKGGDSERGGERTSPAAARQGKAMS